MSGSFNSLPINELPLTSWAGMLACRCTDAQLIQVFFAERVDTSLPSFCCFAPSLFTFGQIVSCYLSHGALHVSICAHASPEALIAAVDWRVNPTHGGESDWNSWRVCSERKMNVLLSHHLSSAALFQSEAARCWLMTGNQVLGKKSQQFVTLDEIQVVIKLNP